MAIADLDKQPDSVSSVLKVFGILQALGEEREIGITELSQRVMMSKSTVYRFLQTMKTLGYVAQEGESEKYSLTLKLFELGARALQNVDLIRSADIQMRELSRLTKETVHLGALDEDSIVYIHKIDSMYNLRMYSRVGRRNPLYSTAIGKDLLAWRDRDEVKQILDGMLGIFAERIGRQLFKLAVEQNVNNHILASDTDIDAQTYQQMRGKSYQEVLRTNGQISFPEVLRQQKRL